MIGKSLCIVEAINKEEAAVEFIRIKKAFWGESFVWATDLETRERLIQ